MLDLDLKSHRRFVSEQLRQLFPAGSFASHLRSQIGHELHLRLVEWPFEEEVEFSRLFPVEALFLMLSDGWSLDPKWMANDDGSYTGDGGLTIPETIAPAYSGAEQLAAYGLWLANTNMDSLGPLPATDSNDFGFSREEVQGHQSECLLLAYQALAYAHRLATGGQLSEEEIEKRARISTARKAAEARHNKPNGSRQKANEIRAIWSTGKYSTRDICAEQECAALGMSFSAARRSLRGTPEPGGRC